MSMKSATSLSAPFPEPGVEKDFSGSFSTIRKSVRDGQGIELNEFIKTLTPRYWVVYRDIGVGYLFIITTVFLAAMAETAGLPVVAVGLATGIFIGYWVAYLQLFIHEGAHWNLAKNRAKNDFLANLLIAWWAAQEIDGYRKIHFQHHRSLGEVDDSERTYFLPLNSAFIVKGLTGILALSVLATRKSVTTTSNRNQRDELGKYMGLS